MRILHTSETMTYYPFDRKPAIGEAVDPDDLLPFELDLTNYTLKCSVPETGVAVRAFSIATAARKVILIHGVYGSFGSVTLLEIDTGTLTDLPGVKVLLPYYTLKSANGKYFASPDDVSGQLHIFKDGASLQDILPDTVASYFDYPAEVSGDGRFIAVRFWNDVDHMEYIRIYEGV